MATKYTKKENVELKTDIDIPVTQEDAKSVETTDNESQLKHDLEEMRKKMEEMQMFIQMMGGNFANTSAPKKVRDITFVNLSSGTIVLKGTHTTHALEGQFTKRTFPEHEAKAILINTPNLIASGRVYITNAEFVKENDLEEIFSKMLNDTQLKTLLEKSPEEVLNIYDNVLDGQKKIIIDTIVNKKLNKQYVDANILMELGQRSGRDLMGIEPMEQ